MDKLIKRLFGGRNTRQQLGLAWAKQHYPPEHQHTAARVAVIIVEQLGVDFIQLRPDTRFIDDLGVGDLDDVELLMAIEEDFWISIPDDDCGEIITVGQLIDYVSLGFTTKSPEAKFETVRQVVISKIHWDARDQEVLDWLKERHGIVGDTAEALLAGGHRARRKAVRGKAAVTLVFSALGILFAACFFGVQLVGGFYVIGYGSFLILVIGCISIGVFLCSLVCLFTGRTSGLVG